MKLFRFKYIAPILGLTLMTASCSKKLDQENPNSITSGDFWKTADDAVKGVNAAYGSLLVEGTYMRSTPFLLDTRGDDVKSNSPWGQMRNTGKFALDINDEALYGWAFNAYYEGIARSNQVIDFVPGIEMDAELKNRVLGQAYFLRGLYFFHLVNMYGNVALPTQFPKSKDDFFVPQSTEQQGWEQVIADLKKAAELLPASYNNVNGPDKNQLGRATKGAAMGYLGKAYLFTKKYSEAAAQFKAVMDLNVYGLMTDYKDNFRLATENNKESIFEVQFDREAGGKDLGWQGVPNSSWGKTSARAITYGPPGFGWTDVQPTRFIFNEFQKEKTIAGTEDPRLTATLFYNKPGLKLYGQDFATYYATDAGKLNDLFVAKYQNSETMDNEFDWRSGMNERLMRYSDILLMYAECLNELGQTSQAYPYIQMVRSRVGLPDLATAKPNMTQQQMRDQIAHERLLEFSLEGHRFDDIKRWGWLKDATKLAQLKQNDPEFEGYVPGRELLPIPPSELRVNKGFTQNSGW
jgi:starch-binding outer membrane protein, SusD/RagB family